MRNGWRVCYVPSLPGTHICRFTGILTYTGILTHTHTHIHKHTYKHTYTFTYKYVYTHEHTCKHIHTHIGAGRDASAQYGFGLAPVQRSAITSAPDLEGETPSSGPAAPSFPGAGMQVRESVCLCVRACVYAYVCVRACVSVKV